MTKIISSIKDKSDANLNTTAAGSYNPTYDASSNENRIVFIHRVLSSLADPRIANIEKGEHFVCEDSNLMYFRDINTGEIIQQTNHPDIRLTVYEISEVVNKYNVGDEVTLYAVLTNPNSSILNERKYFSPYSTVILEFANRDNISFNLSRRDTNLNRGRFDNLSSFSGNYKDYTYIDRLYRINKTYLNLVILNEYDRNRLNDKSNIISKLIIKNDDLSLFSNEVEDEHSGSFGIKEVFFSYSYGENLGTDFDGILENTQRAQVIGTQAKLFNEQDSSSTLKLSYFPLKMFTRTGNDITSSTSKPFSFKDHIRFTHDDSRINLTELSGTLKLENSLDFLKSSFLEEGKNKEDAMMFELDMGLGIYGNIFTNKDVIAGDVSLKNLAKTKLNSKEVDFDNLKPGDNNNVLMSGYQTVDIYHVLNSKRVLTYRFNGIRSQNRKVRFANTYLYFENYDDIILDLKLNRNVWLYAGDASYLNFVLGNDFDKRLNYYLRINNDYYVKFITTMDFFHDKRYGLVPKRNLEGLTVDNAKEYLQYIHSDLDSKLISYTSNMLFVNSFLEFETPSEELFKYAFGNLEGTQSEPYTQLTKIFLISRPLNEKAALLKRILDKLELSFEATPLNLIEYNHYTDYTMVAGDRIISPGSDRDFSIASLIGGCDIRFKGITSPEVTTLGYVNREEVTLQSLLDSVLNKNHKLKYIIDLDLYAKTIPGKGDRRLRFYNSAGKLLIESYKFGNMFGSDSYVSRLLKNEQDKFTVTRDNNYVEEILEDRQNSLIPGTIIMSLVPPARIDLDKNRLLFLNGSKILASNYPTLKGHLSAAGDYLILPNVKHHYPRITNAMNGLTAAHGDIYNDRQVGNSVSTGSSELIPGRTGFSNLIFYTQKSANNKVDTVLFNFANYKRNKSYNPSYEGASNFTETMGDSVRRHVYSINKNINTESVTANSDIDKILNNLNIVRGLNANIDYYMDTNRNNFNFTTVNSCNTGPLDIAQTDKEPVEVNYFLVYGYIAY